MMCLSISQLDSTSSASKLTDHQLHFVLFFSFWCFIDTFLWHKNKIAHHSSLCSGINSSTTEEAWHRISSDQEEEQEGVRMPGRCRDGGCWMKICLHYESLLRRPCRRLNFETNGQSGRRSCSLFLQKTKTTTVDMEAPFCQKCRKKRCFPSNINWAAFILVVNKSEFVWGSRCFIFISSFADS